MRTNLVLGVLALLVCSAASLVQNVNPNVSETKEVKPALGHCGGDVVHGTCRCECNSGTIGEPPNCVEDPCASLPCLNGGSCSITDDNDHGYECECPPWAIGDNCDRPNPCHCNPCQNGGSCSVTNPNSGDYECECPPGFDGDHCENELPCIPNPCQNGGSCSETDANDSGYECECPPGYIGRDCEITGCSLEGGPLQELNYDSGTWLNIFVDFAFSCSGSVTHWRFHAKKTGNVFLTVWRPNNNGRRWTLIGKNDVFVERLGVQTASIPDGDQIQAEEGDVMGMHYTREAADDEDDRGIISYTDTNKWGPGLCCGITEDQLSRIHNVFIQDDELPLGVERRGLRDFGRAVALHAFINSEAQKVPKMLKSKMADNEVQN